MAGWRVEGDKSIIVIDIAVSSLEEEAHRRGWGWVWKSVHIGGRHSGLGLTRSTGAHVLKGVQGGGAGLPSLASPSRDWTGHLTKTDEPVEEF